MNYFDWEEEKNGKLKSERGVCFEDVVTAINEGRLLTTLSHQNKDRYPNQKMYIVSINNYAYVVPFVEDQGKRFFKTIFPSRKMTRKYIIRKEEV